MKKIRLKNNSPTEGSRQAPAVDEVRLKLQNFLYLFFKFLVWTAAFLSSAIVFLLILFNCPVRTKNENMRFGVSFSPIFAKSLGLDPQKAYVDILEGLDVKRVRIASYWNEVEKEKGVYDFSQTDWQVAEARKRGVKIVFAYGIKVPRWPECFIPDFYLSNKVEREEALLRYEKALVERYRNFDNIIIWQVENEPFLPFFGECPVDAIDGDLVDREVTQTKKLDVSRSVMVTDSGELSLWYRAAKRADVFGTTLYRIIYKPDLGYFEYPIGPNFFRVKASLMKIFASQYSVMISELQAEPWGPAWLTEMTIEEQYKSMNPQKLHEIIDYAEKTKFTDTYLWGAEWWYWLKTEKNRPEMWEAAKPYFGK